jgi:hypothetical protein
MKKCEQKPLKFPFDYHKKQRGYCEKNKGILYLLYLFSVEMTITGMKKDKVNNMIFLFVDKTFMYKNHLKVDIKK